MTDLGTEAAPGSLGHFGETRCPVFDGTTEFAIYDRDVSLWMLVTKMEKPRQAAALMGGLSGAAKSFCASLTMEQLKADSGVTTLLNHLRAAFSVHDDALTQNNISTWLDFRRTMDMTVTAFIVGYSSRLARISEIDLSPELQGHLLLRLGLFSRENRGLIVASAGGSYDISKLSNAMKSLWPQGSQLPPLDAGLGEPSFLQNPTNDGRVVPFCDFCTRKGHSKANCWKHLRATGQGAKADELEQAVKEKNRRRKERKKQKDGDKSTSPAASARDAFTFFMPSSTSFLQRNISSPKALIDTGAVATMVGQTTLNNIMNFTGHNRIDTMQLSTARSHRFGPDGEEHQVLFVGKLPFPITDTKQKTYNILLQVDVIAGECPLIIGLPSLVKMGACVSFGVKGDAALQIYLGDSKAVFDLDADTHASLPCSHSSPATNSSFHLTTISGGVCATDSSYRINVDSPTSTSDFFGQGRPLDGQH